MFSLRVKRNRDTVCVVVRDKPADRLALCRTRDGQHQDRGFPYRRRIPRLEELESDSLDNRLDRPASDLYVIAVVIAAVAFTDNIT